LNRAMPTVREHHPNLMEGIMKPSRFNVVRLRQSAEKLRRAVRLTVVSGLAVALAACGGGGGSSSGSSGGGGGGGGEGALAITVKDDLGAALPAAAVKATVGTKSVSGITDAAGLATLTSVPTGTASIEVSKDLYYPQTSSATVATGATVAVNVAIARRVGRVAAKVVDQFDTPVPNATVVASSDGRTNTGKTAAAGTVEVPGVPTGTASVSATADGFKAPAAQSTAIADGAAASLTFKLERVTQAAGGFVTAKVLSNDGQKLTFALQVIVIDEKGAAVSGLTDASFELQSCSNLDSQVIECVRGGGNVGDASYTVNVPPPPNVQPVAALPRIPFFASLLLDQSGSILDTDPTDARIFATKVFLDKVAPAAAFPDVAALAAFAADASEPALIPIRPVTNFGSSMDGRTFFDELDLLANQESGDTPLYEALDTMIAYTRATATTAGKAVVLFTDGKDTKCPEPKRLCLEASLKLAREQDPKIDIFTIGLSDRIDFETMAELADRGNGYFLFAENAQQLIPIYGSLGAMLSKSLLSYTMTWQIQADRAGVFVIDPINPRSVLGKLKVKTATNTLTLPFIVRIF